MIMTRIYTYEREGRNFRRSGALISGARRMVSPLWNARGILSRTHGTLPSGIPFSWLWRVGRFHAARASRPLRGTDQRSRENKRKSRRTRMRPPVVKGKIFPMAIMMEIVPWQETRRERCSALLDFGSGADGCLHQTRIRAQPSRSDGATVRRPPRPETILCPRTVLLKEAARWRGARRCQRPVSCGLGGGADEPSLRSRCLFLKSDSEDPSTVGTRAPQRRLDPPWCSKFWVLSGTGAAGRPRGEDSLSCIGRDERRVSAPLALQLNAGKNGAGAGVQSKRMAAWFLTLDLSWVRPCLSSRRHRVAPRCKVLDGFTLAAPVMRSAHPLPSLIASLHESLEVKRLVPLEHVVDGTTDLGREDTHGFAFPVLALEAQLQALAVRVAPEEERGGFGEGPLEVLVAHLGVAAALRLAIGGPVPLDQAGVGEEVLDPGKAVDGADLVDQRQCQDSADTRDRLQQVECRGVVDLDLLGQEDLQLAEGLLEGIHHGHVDGDGHLDVLVVAEVLEEVVAVRRAVDALADRLEVVLSVGVLDMTEDLGPFAGEEQAPAQQVAGGAHLARVDVGDGEVTAAQEHGELVGVEAVVLGFPAVDRLHIVGVAEDEGDVLVGAQVGDPVPAEEAFDADDQAVAVRLDQLEKAVGITGDVPVDLLLAARLIKDAHVHIARVQVDSAVILMGFCVESHRSLLSGRVSGYPLAYRVGKPGWKGPPISIQAHSRDATAVSIVCGGRRFGSFAERQQPAEGAPLMRMPFCDLHLCCMAAIVPK